MKKIMTLVFLMGIFQSGFSQGEPGCSTLVVLDTIEIEKLGATKRFNEFKEFVQEAAFNQGITDDIVVMVAICNYDGDAWSQKLFDEIGLFNISRTYGVYITIDMLLTYFNHLEHVAVHEICHIMNGDFEKTSSQREIEAEEQYAQECTKTYFDNF